jgi:hypothetical protein
MTGALSHWRIAARTFADSTPDKPSVASSHATPINVVGPGVALPLTGFSGDRLAFDTAERE